MQQPEQIHSAWFGMVIVLEVVANIFLEFSDGFHRRVYGIPLPAAMLTASSALS